MDEVRKANPNPDVDEYRSELDLHKRKFAVQKAVDVHANAKDTSIIDLSKAIYNFLMGEDADKKE